MSDGKAVIYNGKKPLKVDFKSHGTSKIIQSPDSIEKFKGLLVVFNCLEDILSKGKERSESTQKFIDSVASEVTYSLTHGWNGCYFCSFEKYADYGKENLPYEFTILDENKLFYHGHDKVLAKYMNSNSPVLEEVKFVGIISQKELDFFKNSITSKKVKLHLDSPYLVIV